MTPINTTYIKDTELYGLAVQKHQELGQAISSAFTLATMVEYICKNTATWTPEIQQCVANNGVINLTYNTAMLLPPTFDERVGFALTNELMNYFHGNATLQYQSRIVPVDQLIPVPNHNVPIVNLGVTDAWGNVDTVTHPIFSNTVPLTDTMAVRDVINNIPNQSKWRHKDVAVKVLSVYHGISQQEARDVYDKIEGGGHHLQNTRFVNGNVWFMYEVVWIKQPHNNRRVMTLRTSTDLALATAGNMTYHISTAMVGYINELVNVINNSGSLPKQNTPLLSNICDKRPHPLTDYKAIAYANELFCVEHDVALLNNSATNLTYGTYVGTDWSNETAITLYHMDVWYTTYGYTYDQWLSK